MAAPKGKVLKAIKSDIKTTQLRHKENKQFNAKLRLNDKRARQGIKKKKQRPGAVKKQIVFKSK